ncbi:MAG: Gldg family protein [Pseudomonadales bacterium]|nr:Gldg family protein [Pseudomonadales bacterium]
MSRKYYSGLGLALLALAFLLVSMLNNLLFSGVRFDLTENKLYTLSEGSREIVANIQEPINLYFFFSDKASEDLTSLRAYANRVRELLEEYQKISDGRIRLTVVDPEPFSDAEDRAGAFGLQGIPVNNAGDEVYFGLAASNALDDQESIPFFQPSKEEFLEYDISKLIQNLSVTSKPKVGLLSSMKIQGDINMTTFQTTPAWVIADQLGQVFDLQNIEPTADSLPADLDVLVIVHPKNLPESLLFAIDQFALSGGRVMVFVDPMAEADRVQSMPGMPPGGAGASDFPLLTAWGIALSQEGMLADAGYGLTVGGRGGQPVRHLGIVGVQADGFKQDDVVLANLETINMSTAGIIELLADRTTDVETLIHSSAYAQPVDAVRFQMLNDPADLQRDFKPTGITYPLAVRITGRADTAYPDGPPEPLSASSEDNGESQALSAPAVTSTEDLNVIVVADTDMLTDRLWVQVQDFFGQRIASPWANNGDFVVNAVDNLTGSGALISIRSRGRFSRPFDVVQELRREAEAAYQDSADELQAQLNETEQRLTELQGAADENSLLSLSPEQEAELVRFQEEKLRIRRELRDVRHRLDSDIETLGTTLRFLNIALMPVLFSLALMVIAYLRMAGRNGRE